VGRSDRERNRWQDCQYRSRKSPDFLTPITQTAPSRPAPPSTAARALSFAGSFRPGAISTPLFTSSRRAPVACTAATTLSGDSPPARIHVCPGCASLAVRNPSQSLVRPVPPCWWAEKVSQKTLRKRRSGRQLRRQPEPVATDGRGPARQHVVRCLERKMHLKGVEPSLAPSAQLIDGRHDRDRNLAARRQPVRHRLPLRQRQVARGLRVEDETKKVRSDRVGRLSIDERREPADFQSDPGDHGERNLGKPAVRAGTTQKALTEAMTWSTSASVSSGKTGRLSTVCAQASARGRSPALYPKFE
jgi:hypothetical protein